MSKLFEKTTINTMHLNNRFVRSATWVGMANEDGSCTPKLIELMKRLAQGHVGLIISGFSIVRRDGTSLLNQMGAYSEDHMPGLTEMAETVHSSDGTIVVQLGHAGLLSNPAFTERGQMGPSDTQPEDVLTGREMTKDEIQEIVTSFKDSAVLCQKAGFDGIQIHSAHGYLLSQFLSPFFNKREDEYGGSIENRARLVLEVVQSIRDGVGDKFPVLVKMNTDDFLDGGFCVDDMIHVARMLEESGVDAIELSGGTSLALLIQSPDTSFSRLGNKGIYYENAAKRYKEEMGIPLMLVGGIRSYEDSQRLIEAGVCDYISLCRPLIREPDLIKRWESGDTRKAQCLSDNACFVPGLEGTGVHCVHLENDG